MPSSQAFRQNKNKASKALFMFQGPPEIRLKLGFCRITIWVLRSHSLAGFPSLGPKNPSPGYAYGEIRAVSGYSQHYASYQECFFTSNYSGPMLTQSESTTWHKYLEPMHQTSAGREFKKYICTEKLGLQSFTFSLVFPMATGHLMLGVMWVSHKAS